MVVFLLPVPDATTREGREIFNVPTQSTEGFSRREVRQRGVTLRCRRFQGTYLV
jgi:hypothetical protein